MKFYGYFFLGALCLIGGCATGDHQHQLSVSEQRALSQALDQQIDLLAEQIISGLSARNINKIAVIEFSNLDGNVTDLGKYLSEELTTRLFRTGKFQIVERRLMNKMMEEQKLSATGLIDEKTASKFGQVLGVDALATGTMAEMNTSVKVNARLIAVATGTVFAVASAQIPTSKEVELLMGRKPGAQVATDAGRFDGTWDVSVACPPKGAGIGYTLQFLAQVNNGVLHGQQGTEGVGPCLTLDGKIDPDGSAVIRANGLTGDPKYTYNDSQKNTPYFYHIDANFSASRGTGKRVEGRSCNVLFFKQ